MRRTAIAFAVLAVSATLATIAFVPAVAHASRISRGTSAAARETTLGRSLPRPRRGGKA